MSESKTIICPCCPKGCDLSAPRCGRGEEYLRTGIVPEKEACHHHHGDHRRFDDREMSIDEKLFALLSRLGRAGHGIFNGKSSQNRILQILSRSEYMTQRELTDHLGIQPGSASELIKKLETAGLITRRSNSEDRRTVDIALTDAGKAQAEASSTQHNNPDLFKSLTDDEKQQLLSLLEKVGRDWHRRVRGEGRGGHRYPGKCDHDRGHGHGGKHGHDPEHSHGHKQGRGHHHDSF